MDTIRLYKKEYLVIHNSEKDCDNYLIDWDEEDLPNDPQKWSKLKKFSCTFILTWICFLVTFSSSIGSGTNEKVCEEFGVSLEVAEMSTSLFLVGFAMGAPILAPLCEEVGRLPIYIIGMFCFSCFQIGAGVSQNMPTLCICVFFSAFFGTTPLSNAGGSLADMWDSKSMTLMFPFYGVMGFIGPATGPIASSYLSLLGWRWIHYLVAILGFISSLICLLFMRETFKPVIMDLKASSVRRKTGNKNYISIHEQQRNGKNLFSVSVFMRPLLMFITEPIVTSFTICICIPYIVLFSDLESFKYIFATWNYLATESSLPFISVTIGFLIALIVTAPIMYFFYSKKVKQLGSIDLIPPEDRLIPLMICCWFIPISLFWMAWTNYESISPWSSIIAALFFGLGMMQVFITSYTYIIDSYGVNSASALSTLTLLRYNVSAAMIHIADPLYKNLGIHWACSLLGFISLLICIIPFFFWFFGPKLRSLSKLTKQTHHRTIEFSSNSIPSFESTQFDDTLEEGK